MLRVQHIFEVFKTIQIFFPHLQEEAISELIGVVRVVNDSMHSVTIKGLPKAASPLGALVAHDIFQVEIELVVDIVVVAVVVVVDIVVAAVVFIVYIAGPVTVVVMYMLLLLGFNDLSTTGKKNNFIIVNPGCLFISRHTLIF